MRGMFGGSKHGLGPERGAGSLLGVFSGIWSFSFIVLVSELMLMLIANIHFSAHYLTRAMSSIF